MYKRGSALIMVIFTMLIVFTLGLSLLSVVGNEMISTRLEVDSASAYYIARSGIARASLLIENDTRTIITDVIRNLQDSYNNNKLSVNSPDDLYNCIINNINARFLNYMSPLKEGSFYKRLSPYQGAGGIDGRELSSKTYPKKSFYTVNIKLLPIDWSSKTHRVINIVSTGYCANSSSMIDADFSIDYPFKIIQVPAQYTSLPQLLSNSLSVINISSQVFDSCTLSCSSDILLESEKIVLKNSSMNTAGKILMRGKSIDLYNNVKLSGIPVFDYDTITEGYKTEINGSTNSAIPDSLVDEYMVLPPQFAPAAACVNNDGGSISAQSGINNSSTGCKISAFGNTGGKITYIFNDDNNVLNNDIFKGGPDNVYVIISSNDLTIRGGAANKLNFKGIIYCGGNLSIDADSFSIEGCIICRKADFKGKINIENNVLIPEHIDEIASAIKSSMMPGSVSVLGDYDFICERWHE